MIPGERDPERISVGTLLFLGLVVLGALAYLNCLNTDIYRIGLADESIYLTNGLRPEATRFDNYELTDGRSFEATGFENYELFPLHSLWYSLLHTFIADPIVLFKLGAVIQLTLLAVLVVLVCGVLSRLPLVACLLGLSLVATPILGVEASPFAQRTALIVVLLGTWIASRERDPVRRAIPMGIAFFVASFARSEFILAFYLASLGLGAYVLVAHRTRAGLQALASYAALVVALSLLLDFPLLAGSDRSLMAFGQHYALQLEEEGAAIDPWLQWRDAVQGSFGDADSIQGALAENPKAFFGHLLWSAKGLYRWTVRLHPLSLLMLVGCLGTTAVFLLKLFRSLRRRRDPGTEADAVLLLCLGLGVVPILISIFLIAPRNHYLQQFYVLASLMGALALGSLSSKSLGSHWIARNKTVFFCVISAALLSIAPAPEQEDHVARRARILRELVHDLRTPPPRVYSMFRRLSTYVDEEAEEIHFMFWAPAEKSLREYLDETKIDLVFLDHVRLPLLGDDYRVGLEQFAAAPEELGFALLFADDRILAFARRAE